MSSDQARLDELFELKKRKLNEQKQAASKFQHALTDPDGCLENSRLKLKNLAAGIVASRQPGYFKYHQDNERVAQIESTNELPKLNKEIQRLGNDLANIDSEIAEIQARMRKPSEPPKLDSLSQWVATYGKVSDPNPDRVSSFKKSSKVYGGTKHYPSFKSSATTMKRGLCTK
mmetsp:Transcript_53363/g.79307  ORF Transcript_53363/g.79307 Transcript_53363/m.79307 type:complete len:173 (+) Transcript_53363:142-660(+)